MQAPCLIEEIPRYTRDDGSWNNCEFRHPERSEGSPKAGTMPDSGDLSLCSI
ncbi:hypothetical protein [Legionella bononiensis]|uniref:hypothetical protein n=1 Tax=Legionella bononiensis TaxID=2793102 RepID=UPI0019321A6A|nr:hypothetical protein [Legionella bononiensis]MBL7480608.1 hypothetical protein [Legionella bononiensis]